MSEHTAKELSADKVLANRLRDSAQRLREHVPSRLSEDPEIDRRVRLYVDALEQSLLAAAEALEQSSLDFLPNS